MPNTYVKNAGVQQLIKSVYIKDSGIWQACKRIYINNNGVWEQVFGNYGLGSNTYATGGTTNSFTVPAGIYQLNMTATGGGGGAGGDYLTSGPTAGSGISVSNGVAIQGNLAVYPGQTITILPGGPGVAGNPSWLSGTGGTGGVNHTGSYSGTAGASSTTGGGGGGAATVVLINGVIVLVAPGGNGGPGYLGGTGGTGGAVNNSIVPKGMTLSQVTNAGTSTIQQYASISLGPGGYSGLATWYNQINTGGVYSAAFQSGSVVYSPSGGADQIVQGTLTPGYVAIGFNQQSGWGVPIVGAPVFYCGRTVSEAVNVEGNGGSAGYIYKYADNSGTSGYVSFTY